MKLIHAFFNMDTNSVKLRQHRTIASAAGWRVFSPIRAVWKTGNTPSIPLFSKLSAEEKSLATGSCRIVRCCLYSLGLM